MKLPCPYQVSDNAPHPIFNVKGKTNEQKATARPVRRMRERVSAPSRYNGEGLSQLYYETSDKLEQLGFTCTNLRSQHGDLQSECRCLRKERDIAQDELARVQSTGINHFPTYTQIEPCQQENKCPELRKARGELRTLRAKCDDLQSFHDKALPLLEEGQFEHAKLRVERDEARALAWQAYGLLQDWGYICVTCGAMLSRADYGDDVWNCPKCKGREK